MSRRFALAAAVFVMAVAGPRPALAQDAIFVGDGGGNVDSFVSVTGSATGAVSVDFHGDAAGGCADIGLCGVSGTVTWRPASNVQLFAVGYRKGGHTAAQGVLSFTAASEEERRGEPGSVAAQVRRTAPNGSELGLCTDASSLDNDVDLGDRRGGSVAVRIAAPAGTFDVGTDSLRSRCAGPAAADIASQLPARVLSAAALRRGHRRLDFSAEQPFSAHGLAGTVRSNVMVRLGKADVLRPDAFEPEERGRIVARRRVLDVRYRVESVSGQVATDVAGLSDQDACSPLDSCGLLGTVVVAPSATAGDALIEASAPARKRSAADLRRAVGLLHGPQPPGVRLSGFADWRGDRGTVTSTLERAGAADCHASQPLARTAFLDLALRDGVLHAAYARYGETGLDVLRTRCQGPGLDDVASDRALATGTLPLSALRRRRVTLHLNRGARFRSDGYRGRTRPDVTVVLRRVSVRERIDVERESFTGYAPIG